MMSWCCPLDGRVIYIKIHAPFAVLCARAEKFQFKMPLKETVLGVGDWRGLDGTDRDSAWQPRLLGETGNPFVTMAIGLLRMGLQRWPSPIAPRAGRRSDVGCRPSLCGTCLQEPSPLRAGNADKSVTHVDPVCRLFANRYETDRAQHSSALFSLANADVSLGYPGGLML